MYCISGESICKMPLQMRQLNFLITDKNLEVVSLGADHEGD